MFSRCDGHHQNRKPEAHMEESTCVYLYIWFSFETFFHPQKKNGGEGERLWDRQHNTHTMAAAHTVVSVWPEEKGHGIFTYQ